MIYKRLEEEAKKEFFKKGRLRSWDEHFLSENET